MMKTESSNRGVNLRTKFIGVAVVVAIGVLVLGYLGWFSQARLRDTSRRSMETADALTQAVETARRSQVHFKKQVQCWKDILIRGHDADAFAKYQKEFEAEEAATQSDLQLLRTLFVPLQLPVEGIDRALRQHLALGGKYREALKQYVGADVKTTQTVDQLVKGMDREATDTIDGIVKDIMTAVDRVAQQDKDAAARLARSTQISLVTGVVLVFSLIIGVLLAFMASMPKPFRALAHELRATSDGVHASASQVAIASQTLAEGASEQAASLEETSASLEELSSMTKRNAENAQQAKTAAGETRATADAGSAQMQAMQQAMESIENASREITKILKTIDEIAFQTNILALNAAVEAARAGEAGLGFAVVAEEVRALAQRAAQAAKDTAVKIEDSVNKSKQGAQISSEVAKSFATIQAQVRRLDQLVGEIATASNEQSQGIGQVTVAVAQMDQVTQANAASAEETSAAAEELHAGSEALNASVASLQDLVDGAKRPVNAGVLADSPTRPPAAPVAHGKMASPAPARAPRQSIQRIGANGNGRASHEADFFKNAS